VRTLLSFTACLYSWVAYDGRQQQSLNSSTGLMFSSLKNYLLILYRPPTVVTKNCMNMPLNAIPLWSVVHTYLTIRIRLRLFYDIGFLIRLRIIRLRRRIKNPISYDITHATGCKHPRLSSIILLHNLVSEHPPTRKQFHNPEHYNIRVSILVSCRHVHMFPDDVGNVKSVEYSNWPRIRVTECINGTQKKRRHFM
jgi:hypothetical protein